MKKKNLAAAAVSVQSDLLAEFVSSSDACCPI